MRAYWYALAVLLLWIAHPLAQSTQLRIDEWQTPSRSLVQDLAPATDGSVWYTAQQANGIGRLEPSTGKFREFALPAANPHPYGLVLDRYGNVWFTAESYIGRLDPNSGEVKQFDLPGPNAGHAWSVAIDRGGKLWFAVIDGNAIGMLDPQTTKITLTPALSNLAIPDCISVDSKGKPFFELSGAKIGSLDPATGKVTEYPLPDSARVRCLAVAKDDSVYYTDYTRGYLGHVDPATGQAEEFAAPGGPKSMPLGIAITSDGSVWYVETADEGHNVLVRFAPASKKSEAFPLPGTGRVTHIAVGQSDEIWVAEGASGKIARVTWR